MTRNFDRLAHTRAEELLPGKTSRSRNVQIGVQLKGDIRSLDGDVLSNEW